MNPLKKIQSNQRVFIQGGAATPLKLIELLLLEAPRLKDIEIIHIHTMGTAGYADSKYSESFRVVNLFVGPNLRARVDLNRVDYLPCFLSEIPALFRSKRRALDVALIHVSTPDRFGYCSLGTSVDVTLAAVQSAGLVIAQINPQMPRSHGDGMIHINQIHEKIEVSEPIPEVPRSQLLPDELEIGRHVSALVEDGATLQVGIGNIPDAVLSFLQDRKHLGVHSEMWSDGILDLIKEGCIDNSKKKLHPGKTVAGFVTGTKNVYEFVNNNPSVYLLDIEYVNNPFHISQNPKAVSINSAVEIDLTGQVCADSIGCHIISGVGGQMDFMRGATLSPGGKSIIAMTSRTRKHKPRIVPVLNMGAGVVSTRAHTHFVTTEFGTADLYGKTLNERAKALIQIAHPEDREKLKYDWKKLYQS